MSALVAITAFVTRTELGKPDLDINDGVNYLMAPTFDAGGTVWEREDVSSRFMHGSVTVGRRKQTPTFQVSIDVQAASFAALTTAKAVLIEAFEQDAFQLAMTFDGGVYAWNCEAADYAVRWEHVYIHNMRLPLSFSFPRQPIPALGV